MNMNCNKEIVLIVLSIRNDIIKCLVRIKNLKYFK